MEKKGKNGSALIMTVVLTVLLAVVAVVFVAVARMDKAATSNISDNRMLDSTAKSIIEIISKELIFDTPGVAKQAGLSKTTYPQYYDYPDVNDPWLASIEPYNDSGVYKWRQISDINNFLKIGGYPVQNVSVSPPVGSAYIDDYPEIELNLNGSIKANSTWADADGDGIADSKWFELKSMHSSKGRPIYAAVRVIDNSSMVNINTAHTFDVNSNDANKIDGTSQMQVNLYGMLKGESISTLHSSRCGSETDVDNWPDYERSVIWRYGISDGNYMPFDISDELELRYRYCIDSKVISRFEAVMPNTNKGDGQANFGNLYDGSTTTTTSWKISDWENRVTNPADANADRRHFLTAYSLDRIIAPDGNMFSILADSNGQELYNRLGKGVSAANKPYLAQICANIIDYADNDSDVTVVTDDSSIPHYGYESPFIFISEVARNFQKSSNPSDANVYKSYAVELYKNFDTTNVFNNWQLEIAGVTKTLSNTDFNDGGEYCVIVFEDPIAPLANRVAFTDSPQNGAVNVSQNIEQLRWSPLRKYDPNTNNWYLANDYTLYLNTNKTWVENGDSRARVTATSNCFYNLSSPHVPFSSGLHYWRVEASFDVNGVTVVDKGSIWQFTVAPAGYPKPETRSKITLNTGSAISLKRQINGQWVTVDMISSLPAWFCDANDLTCKSYKRDMRWSQYLRRQWNDAAYDSDTLGYSKDHSNSDYLSTVAPIQPCHNKFKTVGDVAMVFRKSAYLDGTAAYQISKTASEADARFDVNDPNMQQIFQYITRIDPRRIYPDDSNETRVKGRININTAPAFVLRQLPWVSKTRTNNTRVNLNIADAIVAYRDKLNISAAGGPDYYHSGDVDARYQETGITGVSETSGFSSIGQLLNVINKSSGKTTYNIRYCGLDGSNQIAFPDLFTDSRSMTDDVGDDAEEREMIFARISDLVTVRSDMFTAYMLVRIGTDGPQKRFMAILDRSRVKPPISDPNNSKVSVKAFQIVPDPK